MSLPFFKKQTSNEQYFGLLIKESEALGFLLEKKGDSISIIAQEKTTFINGWDTVLEQIDDMLFTLEQKKKTKVNKVIFYVYSYLIDQETKNIKKQFLPTFKSIVKHLELKPLGYIECYEAVVHSLENKQQSPLTAVLVELEKSSVSVFVYKGGRKSYAKTIERSLSIVEDLENIFADIKGDIMLPSRIILYDSYDLHTESTTILSHKWSSDLFVQYPRVEIVKPEELQRELVNIFSNQISEPTMTMHDEEEIEKYKEVKKEVLGFTVGGDVSRKIEHPHHVLDTSRSSVSSRKLSLLTSIRASLAKMNINRLFKIPVLKFSHKIMGVITIVAILSLAFLLELFFHKAKINIYFPSRILTKSVTILSSDVKNEITFKSATMSAQLQDKKSTTGKRDVGEPAKGEVTIVSYDDNSRVFSKGTVIETKGIKFALSDDVKVASQSVVIDSTFNRTTFPGKGKVSVVASAIGPEGNLTKNQKFSIADLSSSTFFAVNESAFNGGTKRQVRTVAKQDVEELKESLIKKAQKDAEEKLQKTNGEQVLLKNLTETVLDASKTTKEVGEEANEVGITVTTNTTYYTYSKKDLSKYLEKQFSSDISPGYKIDSDKINAEVKKTKNNGNDIVLDVAARASEIRKISSSEILSKVTGRQKSALDKILKLEFQALRYDMKSNTPVFFLNGWLPFFQKNIEIIISS